ncbi:MAG TPA: peptidase [Leptolyngbyaceae cyanobacterium M33_DOE_097]|uniref:Peptidase n=1 Tax=Oscillatoriales cyanobacterium SpSt-418 TaxID=2282169 RepID=A0A7C3KF86_9CYAN|nr:peptidase [Leptolyngbyaceae cyanobacterium M33_DOE_097]
MRRYYIRQLFGRSQFWRSLLFSVLFSLIFSGFAYAIANQVNLAQLPQLHDRLAQQQLLEEFATAKPHPMPPQLSVWRSPDPEDYFDQIQPVSVGYLVWSEFPVKVYVEPSQTFEQANDFLKRRADAWVAAVQTAVQEWADYLPLELVPSPEAADITIWRKVPPLQFETDEQGKIRPARARSAETRFELYRKASPPRLAHRFSIWLRPDQAQGYFLAAARHELGHALGIWGHSPLQTDALYFSQVRTPPPISARDVNTLKRVYEQPTRLGWAQMGDRVSVTSY